MVEIKQSCKGLLASSNANENIESYTHKQSVKTRLPHQLKIGDFIGNYLRAGLVGLLSVEVWEYVTGQQYGQVNSKQGNLKMIQFASNTVLQNQ